MPIFVTRAGRHRRGLAHRRLQLRVWELDADLAQVDLLVNTIGNYTGSVLVNLTEGVTTSSLEITADGNWRVEVKPREDARRFDASIDGTGDDVVVTSTVRQCDWYASSRT
jgi:hypothetical protein